MSGPEQQARQADHSHFFNLYGVLKLLFKKKDQNFVGRFHEKYPISVKNPITNARIIGEVEFYRITNRNTNSVQLSNKTRHLNPDFLVGEFFGTDFNFAYSTEIQKGVADNCLQAEWDSCMKFEQINYNERMGADFYDRHYQNENENEL